MNILQLYCGKLLVFVLCSSFRITEPKRRGGVDVCLITMGKSPTKIGK